MRELAAHTGSPQKFFLENHNPFSRLPEVQYFPNNFGLSDATEEILNS